MHDKACALFGYDTEANDASKPLEPALRTAILKQKIDTFWCCGFSGFDLNAALAILKLQDDFPGIKSILIRASLPTKPDPFPGLYDGALYPDGLESLPSRLAVVKRNQWMVKHCDLIIASAGNDLCDAYEVVLMARRYGNPVVNLGSFPPGR